MDVMLLMAMFVAFSMGQKLTTLDLRLFRQFLDSLLRVITQNVLLLRLLKLMLVTVLLQQAIKLLIQK